MSPARGGGERSGADLGFRPSPRRYFALLAKHTGIDFLATKLVLMIHGPLRWARTSNGQPLDSLEDAEVDFLERESIRVADLLVSPSRYLLGWVRGQGEREPGRVEVEGGRTHAAGARADAQETHASPQAGGPRPARTARSCSRTSCRPRPARWWPR